MVAVFIFVAIFIMFTGIMTSMSKSQGKKLLSEKSDKITKILSTDSPIAFIKGNKVDDSKLKEIVGDYDAFKTEFDYDKFCVYFEDENGNLIAVKGVQRDANNQVITDPVTNEPVIVEYNGIGNPAATVNDVKCGVGG